MNDRTQFLEARRHGIGGSDVSAILGLNPWKTPLEVYDSKVNPPDPEDLAPSEAAYWGQTLEDVVAREYALRTGRRIQRVNTQIVHPLHNWARANIDRAIVAEGTRARPGAEGGLLGAEALLECKTAGAYSASDWGRDGDDEAVPTHYAAQVMWYLACTGLERADFAVLIGGQRFLVKTVTRDDAVIAELLDRCSRFWHDHVLARRPPPPVNIRDVLRLFPADDGRLVDADDAMLAAHDRARELKRLIQPLADELDQCTDTLKQAIGAAAGLQRAGQTLVTWKAAKASTVTDWEGAAKRLAALYDEARATDAPPACDVIAEATTTKPGSRRFLFLKLKEIA